MTSRSVDEIRLAGTSAPASRRTRAAGAPIWQRGSLARRILRQLLMLLIAGSVAVLLWIAVLEVFQVNPLFGARPWTVWEYLFPADGDATDRDAVFADLAITVRDAAVGYGVGMAAAYAVAIAFTLAPSVERSVIPLTLVLRTMPLVVLTPLITFIFGTGLGAVTVVVVLVVFFPALVNIVYGLRSANPQFVTLVRAYQGTRGMLLRKLLMPSSLPATFAAARMSVPAAVTGAMIAEWLATGEGLGGSISRAAGSFGYTQMWASAVTIAAVTMLAYSVVSIAEIVVSDRFGAVQED